MGVKGEVERTPQNVVGDGGWGGISEGGGEGGDEQMGGVQGGDGGREGGVDGNGEEGKKGGSASWVDVTVDIPGQRDDEPLVVFLGAMIREAVVGEGGLQRNLWINGGWHWRLYVDVSTLSTPCLIFIPTSTQSGKEKWRLATDVALKEDG